MRQDSLLADVKELQQIVNRLSALETPAPGKGLWADRPTTPVQDQQYFATDATRKIQYFWDVTAANWLSTQKFPLAVVTRPDNTLVSNVLAATRADVLYASHPDGASDLYIVNFTQTLFLPTAQSGVNFWTANVILRDNTRAITNTYTGDTKLFTTANRLNTFNIAVGAVVTKANFFDLFVGYVLTAVPGNLNYNHATLWHRLIG